MLRHQVIIASAFVTGSATGCVSGQDGPTSGDPNGSDPSDPSDPGAGDLTYTWIAGAFGTCSAVCGGGLQSRVVAVSYTHLRAHETPEHLVCRLLLEKKKT